MGTVENKKNVKRSVFWSAIDRFSVQGLGFLMSIVISRFVMPEEYGSVAMLGIFIAVSHSLIDSGFSTALIQKQDRTDADMSTVFYTNMGMSVLLYLLLYAVSPLIAAFYNEPRLELLTKVVCLNIVIYSATLVQNTHLIIQMDFKSIYKASIISALVSGLVGIALAWLGYGVWALVVQSFLSAAVKSIALWFFSSWSPLLRFSTDSLKQLFGFGSKFMFSGILHHLYLNLYTLVIGRFYNATEVGLFNRANSISQYPSTNIQMVLNRVFFPVLCEKQDDVNSFSEAFHRYLRLSCYIIFPLSLLLAAIASPLIRFLLTDAWEGVILPLQIIAVAYMLFPLMLVNNQPLQALNHTDMFFYTEIVKKVVAVLLLFASLRFGLYVLCLSILAYNLFDSVLIVFFTRRIMPTGFRRQIREIAPIFAISAVMGLAVYAFVCFSPFGHFLTIVLGIALGGADRLLCLAAWLAFRSTGRLKK